VALIGPGIKEESMKITFLPDLPPCALRCWGTELGNQTIIQLVDNTGNVIFKSGDGGSTIIITNTETSKFDFCRIMVMVLIKWVTSWKRGEK
jgi:hypothetical protein